MNKISSFIKLLIALLLISFNQSCTKENDASDSPVKLFYVSPNPCDNIIYAHITVMKVVQGSIRISGDNDVIDVVIMPGNNMVPVDVSDQKPGVLFIELTIGTTVDKIKFIKE